MWNCDKEVGQAQILSKWDAGSDKGWSKFAKKKIKKLKQTNNNQTSRPHPKVNILLGWTFGKALFVQIPKMVEKVKCPCINGGKIMGLKLEENNIGSERELSNEV